MTRCCWTVFSYVLGVDIDPEALAICANNISEFDITNIDLLHCDIRSLVNHPGRLHGAFDVVVMNPPFGTKNNQGKYCALFSHGTNHIYCHIIVQQCRSASGVNVPIGYCMLLACSIQEPRVFRNLKC